MLIPVLLTVAIAVGVVLLLRLVARRELRPVQVLASGTLPAASRWVRPALVETASAVTASTSWADDEDGGLLNGHRGELVTKDGAARIIASLQPHPVEAEIDRLHPVRVSVELAEYPVRGGLWRLIGRTVRPDVLAVRRQLQLAIAHQVRKVDGTARCTQQWPTGRLAVVGLVVVVAAAGFLVGPPLVERLSAPAAPVHQQPPAAAVVCAASGKTTTEPSRSAADAKKRCRLAERARAAYLKQPDRQPPVKLRRVTDPATKKKYDLTCTGTDLVTCTKGKTRVYLFTPA